MKQVFSINKFEFLIVEGGKEKERLNKRTPFWLHSVSEQQQNQQQQQQQQQQNGGAASGASPMAELLSIAASMAGERGTGIVKAVVSGDTLVLVSLPRPGALGPPPEREITLSCVRGEKKKKKKRECSCVE